MHSVLGGTGVEHELAIIRNATSSVTDFRASLNRFGLHLAVEVAKHLPSETSTVHTPLAVTTVQQFRGKLVLVPVLRAGLGLLNSFLEIMPYASVGFEGLRRDEVSLLPEEYYSNLPPSSTDTTYLILDPMLATGGSLCATISRLHSNPHSCILAVSVIAAPEGLERVTHDYPDVNLIIGAVDSHLNDVGYIVPGLGDAGDRLYGTT